MNLADLDYSILWPALLAGLLVLTTHVPLGQNVLSRGIIFIDLAIAQVAGLGVIAAANIGWDEHGVAAQVAAMVAALGGALLLWSLEKYWPEIQEALIGVLFVLAASASILLMAHNPEGGEHLRDLLVGQILWVDVHQLILPALIYAAVLLIWFRVPGSDRPLIFYPLFAVTVTVSVQLVGVYLVFASLIIPAIAARNRRGVSALGVGYLTGVFGYASGLLLSLWLDLPAGALIVCCLVGWVTPWMWTHRKRG